MKQIREILFYKNYFREFYDKQSLKVQEKIDYVLYLISRTSMIPEKFLKHIEGQAGLYEVRVEQSGNIYRIFCCFDKGNIIILFNGFQKKTNKTPKQEINKAVKLMKEYLNKK